MQLSPEHYQASKQFLLDFAALNIKTRLYQVNRGVYAYIPTTEGSVKFKANDIFKFHYKDDHIVSFVYGNKQYEPIWPQCKLNEWLHSKLRFVESTTNHSH